MTFKFIFNPSWSLGIFFINTFIIVTGEGRGSIVPIPFWQFFNLAWNITFTCLPDRGRKNEAGYQESFLGEVMASATCFSHFKWQYFSFYFLRFSWFKNICAAYLNIWVCYYRDREGFSHIEDKKYRRIFLAYRSQDIGKILLIVSLEKNVGFKLFWKLISKLKIKV